MGSITKERQNGSPTSSSTSESDDPQKVENSTSECQSNPAEHLAPPHPRRFECSTCKQRFSRKHNMVSHETTHFENKVHQCLVCDMHFRRVHDLKRHQALHTGERPFRCGHCYRAFARPDALTRHRNSRLACATAHQRTQAHEIYTQENAATLPMPPSPPKEIPAVWSWINKTGTPPNLQSMIQDAQRWLPQTQLSRGNPYHHLKSPVPRLDMISNLGRLGIHGAPHPLGPPMGPPLGSNSTFERPSYPEFTAGRALPSPTEARSQFSKSDFLRPHMGPPPIQWNPMDMVLPPRDGGAFTWGPPIVHRSLCNSPSRNTTPHLSNNLYAPRSPIEAELEHNRLSCHGQGSDLTPNNYTEAQSRHLASTPSPSLIPSGALESTIQRQLSDPMPQSLGLTSSAPFNSTYPGNPNPFIESNLAKGSALSFIAEKNETNDSAIERTIRNHMDDHLDGDSSGAVRAARDDHGLCTLIERPQVVEGSEAKQSSIPESQTQPAGSAPSPRSQYSGEGLSRTVKTHAARTMKNPAPYSQKIPSISMLCNPDLES